MYALVGMRRGPAIVCLLAVAFALAAGPSATARAEQPAAAQPSEDERKAVAKAEVQAARAAFSSGEYQAAIAHYQAAMAILPAPKLHYNIAVCHQRLSVQAEAAEERTRQRDLAVESYNRYLEQNPRAEDRLEVAEIIRELGGVPVTMPSLKPLFDGDEQADASASQPADPGESQQPSDPQQQPSDSSSSPTEQSGASSKPPYYPSHGRFGLMFAGGYSPMIGTAEAIDAPIMSAVDLHGGGFIGKHRRFLLAASTMLFSGTTLRPNGLSFYGYSIGLLGQQTWVLGREGVQLSFGGVAALTGQGLNQREDVAPPLCRRGDGVQVASRTGGLFAPRFDLGILLGMRRRGAISLLVQPSFAVFGAGPTGEQCSEGQTPWTVLGVRQRWDLQLWAGAGYSFRF